MADISKIKTLDGTTYDLKDTTARNNKVEKSGDTMTGNLIVPATRVANTYYGISFDRTTSTPVETILYTGIKWVSNSHMPVIHVTGYAYGLQSPVEFKIGFYIYNDKIGYCGVTNMGAWSPQVYLFKYTRSSIDYVAVGFAGSCYFLQLSVDLQDEMGKFANVVTDNSAWSWSFLTTAGTIPSVDDGSTCVQVPYKANILNPSKVNDHTVKSDVPADAKFTDTTYESKTAASGGTALSLVTTGEKYIWNNKGSYSKPSSGIPKTDLTSAVQTSLEKADSALQSHQTIKQDGVTGATVNRFGTCSTAAGTAAKTVNITTGTFALEAGARVTVKFTNANTANTPTLNVNSKGAKNIFHKGAQITSGGNKALLAGTVDFVYDGTQWHLIGNYIDTTNAGTITGITMNGVSKGTSGVVDLGTVITAHQDISGKLNSSLKGAANGLAELDANGKVPSTQLPSYVDDVLEYNGQSAFPATGETGKIYIDTATNKTYRWGGSSYVEISSSLALGETSSTAYRGDRGKIAYNHSQSTHARTDATAVTASSTNGNIKINGTETTVYTHPGSGTNPHGTTKSDVGLGNVGNFKAVSTVANQGLTDSEKSNARANIGAGTSSLTLGTSSSTAYRGDYGNSAYTHAVTNKGKAFSSGLYKITTNSEGHVTAATAVTKTDITALGIPESDTKYESKTAVSGGTTLSLVTTGEKYLWNTQTVKFGVCNTAADSVDKVASCTDTVQLVNGFSVNILFVNSNTAMNTRININNTGFYLIKSSIDEDVSTTIHTSWDAGTIVNFIYYNSYWIIKNKTPNSIRIFDGSMIGMSSTDDNGNIIMSTNNKYMGLVDKIPCLPNTSYTVRFNNLSYDRPHCYLTTYDIDGSFLSRMDLGNVSYLNSITFDTSSTTFYFHVYYYKSPGADISSSTYIKVEADTSNSVTSLNNIVIDLLQHTATKAPLIYNTASGKIASFFDGADNLPIKKLSADIYPIQNFNGYDYAWSAGGGKNLIDESKWFYSTNNKSIYIGSNSDSFEISLLAGTYTLSCTFLNGVHYGAFIGSTAEEANVIWTTSSTENTGSFTLSKNTTIRVWFYHSSMVQKENIINIQLEKGETKTDWSPYENHCPLSSRTNVAIYQEEEYNNTAIPKIEVSFENISKTIYGGIIDLNTQTLISNMECTTFYGNSSERWAGFTNSEPNYNRVQWNGYNDIGLTSGIFISDKLTFDTIDQYHEPFHVYNSPTAPRMFITIPKTITSMAKWKAFLAENPITIAYTIAEKTTYQLSLPEIKSIFSTLYGKNSFWTDNGIIHLEYPADTKLYIDNKIEEAVNRAI